MKTVVTHSGNFHPDDVFAVACISILEGAENISIVRTRDESIIKVADWVVDVGGEYDPERKRFDHHQNGAPVRENGIPYAAFGLVWKHYGEQIAGSKAVAHAVEERLCQAIDAPDNGIGLFDVNEYKVCPVLMFHVLDGCKPVWGSDEDIDTTFLAAVEFVQGFLLRYIAQTKGKQAMFDLIEQVYKASEKKTVLLFEKNVDSHALIKYPDVKAIVYPSTYGGTVTWSLVAIPKEPETFEPRTSFPESWAGLRGAELAVASGIAGLFFCHKNRYMVKGKNKEAVVKAIEFLQ